MNTEETTVEDVTIEETVKPVVPTKSKGQLFKEKNGYSKTMKRNMKKHNCRTPEQYRDIRNSRKREGFPALPKTKVHV